jgi:putative transposase
MIICVPPPALPHRRPALRLAGPGRPVVGFQERRATRAAARGRRAAPRQSPAPAGLGRPRHPRHADPAPAGKAASASADHPRHCPAVAPPPGHAEVDLPEPDRTAAGQRRDRRADRAARHREPRRGIQEDPRRAAQARPPGWRIHDPQDPQGPEDPPGAETAHRRDVAAVPAPRHRRCSPPTSFMWTARLALQRVYCLFIMEAGSRYVHIPGITANPDGLWTVQQTATF